MKNEVLALTTDILKEENLLTPVKYYAIVINGFQRHVVQLRNANTVFFHHISEN